MMSKGVGLLWPRIAQENILGSSRGIVARGVGDPLLGASPAALLADPTPSKNLRDVVPSAPLILREERLRHVCAYGSAVGLILGKDFAHPGLAAAQLSCQFSLTAIPS